MALPAEHQGWKTAVNQLGLEVATWMVSHGELACSPGAPRLPYRLIDPSDVEPRAVEWLWRHRIPTGTLSLIVGPGGIGKGALWSDLAAQASRGELDGDFRGSPISVVVLSAEERIADVISPRLRAAGAAPNRVKVMTMVDGDYDRDATFPDDLAEVRRVLERTRARMLVVDPLNAHLHDRLDSHKDAPLRRALGPLTRLAGDTGTAVIGIAHVNKGSGDALNRVLGSVGYVNAARAVLIVGRPPDDADGSDRIVAVPKSNLTPPVSSLRLRLESREVEGVLPDGSHGPVEVVGIEWRGEDRATADDLLGSAEDRSALAEASDWLRDALEDGPFPKAEIARQARADGIAERTLQRARRHLGVTVERDDSKQGRPATWGLEGFMPSTSGTETLAEKAPLTGQGNLRDQPGYVPSPGGGTRAGEESPTATDRPTCEVCGLSNSSGEPTHPTCGPAAGSLDAVEVVANLKTELGATEVTL